MKKLAIIGFGSMGKMILENLSGSPIFRQIEVVVHNRTFAKIEHLKNAYPNVSIVKNLDEAVAGAETAIVCCGPNEVPEILTTLAKYKDVHLVSIAAAVSLENLSKRFEGKITRILPTIISAIGCGVTLVCHNKQVPDASKKNVESIFSSMSRIQEIPEDQFGIASDLTSSAPGIISAIFEEYLRAALKHSNLDRKLAESMLIETVFGTAKLWKDKKTGFQQTIERVATPGGITQEAVDIVEDKMRPIFEDIIVATLAKAESIQKAVSKSF